MLIVLIILLAFQSTPHGFFYRLLLCQTSGLLISQIFILFHPPLLLSWIMFPSTFWQLKHFSMFQLHLNILLRSYWRLPVTHSVVFCLKHTVWRRPCREFMSIISTKYKTCFFSFEISRTTKFYSSHWITIALWKQSKKK